MQKEFNNLALSKQYFIKSNEVSSHIKKFFKKPLVNSNY